MVEIIEDPVPKCVGYVQRFLDLLERKRKRDLLGGSFPTFPDWNNHFVP